MDYTRLLNTKFKTGKYINVLFYKVLVDDEDYIKRIRNYPDNHSFFQKNPRSKTLTKEYKYNKESLIREGNRLYFKNLAMEMSK